MTIRQSRISSTVSPVSAFEIANRLFFRLYQASNLLHKTGTRAVGDYGATTQQWAVLGALARPAALEDGLSVKQLLEYLLVSRQNLTPVLDRLETAGLVERVRDEADGRKRQIRLTANGREVWGRMRGDIERYYVSALEGFSLEESFLLMRLLERLGKGLERLDGLS